MSAAVNVTTVVALDPQAAFEVFTDEVDAWWKHGPRFRQAPPGESAMRFEGGSEGRLIEVFADDGRIFELGRITLWKPPERLVMEMGGRDFAPDDPWPEVEVRFEPVGGGTRVSVEHRGFEALPADHGVWHGLSGEAFYSMMGLWWADLLVGVRAHAKGRGDGSD